MPCHDEFRVQLSLGKPTREIAFKSKTTTYVQCIVSSITPSNSRYYELKTQRGPPTSFILLGLIDLNADMKRQFVLISINNAKLGL